MARKKVMMVLPPRDFDGEAYTVIRRTLEGRGHTVTVTSVITGSIRSENGSAALVDIRIHDVAQYQYDSFVFVGGEGVRLYFDNDQVQKLASDVKFKTIAATGDAAVVFALAGLLKKKRATSPAQFAGLLIEHGAEYTGTPIEVDDKIMTLKDSSGSTAIQFANMLAEAIE